PHGDSAVYDTMVRMAQSFSLRYPLVEGHGNFGNVDGDPAAAYRYTEARMEKIAAHMMSDIEKNVVDFAPNFDNSRKEPTVLPSRFPNILVNGAVGIAFGMATNIPPHNLTEVIDGTIYRMDHPDCSVEELMQYIKGPDFPTYGIIYGSRGMYDAYATGRGRVIVRARARIEENEHRIIVTEIPYMVNKTQLASTMGDLVKNKKIEGITDIRDESGRAGMRIVVEYRRDANGEVILNQLYKYTQLQSTCAVNMLALVGGEPKVLTLPDILDHYIRHQEEVITRRTRYELEKSLHEMHIFEGYKIALDHIDEVIEIIRHSSSIPDAKEKLMASFGLSEAQAQAIVEMTLGKLSGLERQKIEDRLEKLTLRVEELRGILADKEKIKDIIREELETVKEKYGDARRTELVEAMDEIDLEDLIPRHTCVITLTHAGYIKRQPASTYSAQNRGGRGIRGMTTKEEDFVKDVLVANSHEYLMFFTNFGKVYTKKTYRIPEASRTAKGTNIVNVLEGLAEGERITAIIPIAAFSDTEYLTMVTKRGIIKRTLLSEYEYQRKGG
ncbi:MAG: DNA gyrase subunit A, partial [Clostridia bacterium]|nr:DNA gyrase subunit A [Clostridia bacterium]